MTYFHPPHSMHGSHSCRHCSQFNMQWKHGGLGPASIKNKGLSHSTQRACGTHMSRRGRGVFMSPHNRLYSHSLCRFKRGRRRCDRRRPCIRVAPGSLRSKSAGCYHRTTNPKGWAMGPTRVSLNEAERCVATGYTPVGHVIDRHGSTMEMWMQSWCTEVQGRGAPCQGVHSRWVGKGFMSLGFLNTRQTLVGSWN